MGGQRWEYTRPVRGGQGGGELCEGREVREGLQGHGSEGKTVEGRTVRTVGGRRGSCSRHNKNEESIRSRKEVVHSRGCND
jgi:hypothetical protein